MLRPRIALAMIGRPGSPRLPRRALGSTRGRRHDHRPRARRLLRRPPGDAVLAEADVLLGHWGCPTLTADVLARAPRLASLRLRRRHRQVASGRRGVGARSVRDVGGGRQRHPVAEYTVAMIVLANKGALLFAARERDPDAVVPLSHRISNLGKKVGLVGASLVGRHVIELLRSYELDVAVADPYLEAGEAERLGVGRMELDELCSWCDVLSLHAPEIDSTRGMIGADQLARLHTGPSSSTPPAAVSSTTMPWWPN